VNYNQNVEPLFGWKRDMLVTRLLELKSRAAKEMNVPANALLSNAAMENLIRVRPTTWEALQRVEGLPELRARQLGTRIITVMAVFCKEHSLSSNLVS